MKNKKGSHIEMILSFSIFMTFLVFFYFILVPSVKSNESEKISLNNLREKLLEQTKVELNVTTLKITGALTEKDCIKIDKIGKIIELNNLIIRDNIQERGYSVSGDTLYIKKNSDNLQGKFFKIYSSDEFPNQDETLNGCDNINENEYSIGLTKSESYNSETKINEQITLYNADYKNFKRELNVPAGADFGFIFINNGDTIREAKIGILSKEVYAERMHILYFDDKANVLSGFIVIQVL